METEQIQYGDVASPNNVAAIEGINPQNLPKLPPAKTSQNQWQRIGKTIANFWKQLPTYLENFFNSYKQLLITLAWILAAIISVKVIIAMLDAINDVPLAQPLLELIGISYATWFSFRYLLKASTRRELVAEIDLLKQKILG